jgi:hypothetical protein
MRWYENFPGKEAMTASTSTCLVRRVMISPSYKFFSRKHDSAPPKLEGVDIAFVGDSIDERGSATIDALTNAARSVSSLRYYPDDQKLFLNGEETRRDRLVKYLSGAHRIIIDATTLGLGEILNVLIAAKAGQHPEVEFLYAEPKDYTKSTPESGEDHQHRNFALTTNCRFQGIHGFAHSHQSNMPATHVFLLGFEPARIRNAIEQRGDIDGSTYEIHVVIGVPAFQTGWEGNSIRTHLNLLDELDIGSPSITYCPANSVRETYLNLWDLYRQLGDERKCFYVSPLGTKPHTIATTLFLLETKGCDWVTSLYYDHPERISKRSSGYLAWHHTTVRF